MAETTITNEQVAILERLASDDVLVQSPCAQYPWEYGNSLVGISGRAAYGLLRRKCLKEMSRSKEFARIQYRVYTISDIGRELLKAAQS